MSSSHAKRVDANQAEIVAALRAAGATVCDLHECGHGVPDLLIAHGGRLMLMEVKAPGARLNSREALWHAEWPMPVAVVHSVEEALEALEDARREL